MKRILFIPINYNSYKELDAYLKSISIAFGETNTYCDLVVHIADNSTKPKTIDCKRYNIPLLRISAFNNPGYLGGACNIINNVDNIHEYDFVIISNVDVTVSEDFFTNLLKAKTDNIGWIAPQIYSYAEERDRNPKIMARPSKRKLQMLKAMYRYPILHQLYNTTLYKRKKLAKHNAGQIYAGHGSFMIMTKNFFNEYPQLHYPVFLFGEEIFLGELCLKKDLKVMYDPKIKVYDREHVSTGQMKSSFYYKCNHEAIAYSLKLLYEQN